jgi:maltooligosyltrehalose trehalohydrolase
LYQGQRYSWQDNPRGTPALDICGHRFVNYLQNHDQLANSARGARLQQITSPGRYRAMTALLLLGPQTPLPFQGQEFAASTPFLYFNDCAPDEQDSVRRGRAEFLSQFRSLGTEAMQQLLPDPCDPSTFLRSKLDHTERARHVEAYSLHRDLLRLRRDDEILSRQIAADVHGAVLGPDAFFLRYLPPSGDTRLLIVNFDRDLRLASVPHPLIAPPAGNRWTVVWSSEDPVYGGGGTADLETAEGWRIPGESAVLLAARAGSTNS